MLYSPVLSCDNDCLMTAPIRPQLHEWAKQLAIWLGITTLVPLVAYFGTAAFNPPPDADEFARVQARLNEELASAPDAQKDKLRAEIDRRQKENTDAERAFARRMFWVAYPVGLIVFVIGVVVPIQAVGAGLMFGGIISLADGCYTSWDFMGLWLRLGSLVFALLAMIVLGLWRFRPRRDPPLIASSHPKLA
jgi:hypothetical protein